MTEHTFEQTMLDANLALAGPGTVLFCEPLAGILIMRGGGGGGAVAAPSLGLVLPETAVEQWLYEPLDM